KSLLASDEYRFGESLTQEVAYEGLLLKQRRQLHERVALQVEPEPGKAGPERTALLAHHWARSDDRVKAMVALLRAAQDAEDLPSYRTAVAFSRRLWELAEVDADDPASRRAALAATTGLARLSIVFGWPPLEEAERAARRARELAEALGDTEMLPGVLYFLGVITMLGEDFERGLALAEQGVAVASGVETHAMALSAPNRTVQAGSAGTLAQILFLRGEYAEALRWADESLEGNEAIGNLSGFTAPAAVALAARATLGLAADTERYLELIEQGLASGRTVQANFRFVADAYLALGDAERAERFVEALRARPNSSGRLREAYLETAVGEVMLGLGRPEEAERPFARALALAETIG